LLTVYAVISGPSTSCSVVPSRCTVGLTAAAVPAVKTVTDAMAAAPIAVFTADLLQFTLTPFIECREICRGTTREQSTTAHIVAITRAWHV
jgi:hypothetical protein